MLYTFKAQESKSNVTCMFLSIKIDFIYTDYILYCYSLYSDEIILFLIR